MTKFSFMLFPDGSWCETAGATSYLKETSSWLEVTGETTLLEIADHLNDEKMTGSIIGEMLG